MKGEFSEPGMTIHFAANASSDLKWQLFEKVRHSAGFMLLYHSPLAFNILSRDFFASEGDCISSLKAQRCSGLKGQAKAACNHAQIGICHATFNVPSAHNS